MEKVSILAVPPVEGTMHAHLEIVVDFLLLHGNSLAHNFRWGSNREGYFCHLRKPIDFNKLNENFDFPKSIIFGEERNVIFCQNTGCIIQTIA